MSWEPGAVPRRLARAQYRSALIDASTDEALLRLATVGRFLVRPGRPVVVERAPGATDEDVSCFVQGPGKALAALRRFPLRGAAVDVGGRALVVCGAGTGSSSLAAALALRGHPVLGDSVVLVDRSMAVEPTGADVVLWPDVANDLGLSEGRILRPALPARVHSFPAAPASVPLGALVVLAVDGRLDDCPQLVEVEELEAARRISALLGAQWYAQMLGPLGLAGEHFEWATSLAQPESHPPGPAGPPAAAGRPVRADREGPALTGQTVWLASYPKSGSTWLRAVYTAWRRRCPPDLNDLDGNPIGSDRRAFDAAIGLPSSLLTADEVDLLRPRADEAITADATAPGWRKIHDALFPGPAGEPIVSLAATRAAVYLLRDPRDVAVSYAHHMDRTVAWAVEQLSNPEAAAASSDGSLDPQVRQRLGTWSDHVRSWVDQSWFPVHVVRYEDCAADPVTTFTAALHAGGLEVTDAEVAAAVERSSFARLRAEEQAGGFKERPVNRSAFFRRGQVGGWRDELPAALARRVAEDHGEVMARFGYEPS